MAFTNFIPEVWSARLLEHLDNVHVYSALLNRDYPELERQTHEVLARAMNDLSFYGA